MDQCISTVMYAIKNSVGGELFIPKMPSLSVIDIAKAINPKLKIKYIGIRPGEKIHEELISNSDALNTYNLKDYFVILPPYYKDNIKNFHKYIKFGKKVHPNFSYTSDNNKKFLSIKKIKELINKNMNSFELDL